MVQQSADDLLRYACLDRGTARPKETSGDTGGRYCRLLEAASLDVKFNTTAYYDAAPSTRLFGEKVIPYCAATGSTATE